MLGFTIANRSMNNFTHVVETLAAGMQPDPDTIIANGGYVIRNAGWYGNGRHGTRAWKSMAGHPLGLPYHADMFALYLWRIASFDIVEAAALARNPRAARLSPATKAGLGVGNSSGMGMVAALVRWPEWFGAYNFVRELCLAHALTRPALAPVAHAQLVELLRRASAYHRFQPESPVGGFTNPETLSDNLEQVASHAAKLGAGEIRSAAYPLRAVAGYAATFDRETLEQTHSILIELYPDFAAAAAELLTEIMNMPRTIDPTMSVGTLTEILEARYDWALAIDLNAPGAREYFWYRSEESGENRRGERAVDAGVANETFVDVAGAMQTLRDELARQEPDRSIGLFLLLFPEFSRLVARAQLAQKLPYTEIRANIIDRSFRPCDAIRFLLSTMGLEAARPNNERYVRGVFLQGAPLPDDIAQGRSVDWIFPDIKPQPETASAR
jgi:hypothetical protein